MAVKQAKVLTEDDYLRKEYGDLVNINQKLKAISEAYYIGYNNVILMKSLVPFIEKVVFLNNDLLIPRFRGMMILPNKLFHFKKNAKKTKLIFVNTEDTLYMGQDDNEKLKVELNRVLKDNPDNIANENTFTQGVIVPEMYRRYFIITKDIDFDKLSFYQFSAEDVEGLAGTRAIEYHQNGIDFIMTKNLFLDIKADDELSVAHLPVREDAPTKRYLFFKHTTDLYTDYTLVAHMKPADVD